MVKVLPAQWLDELSLSLTEKFLQALLIFSSHVAKGGSRLLHSACQGQLGESAGADKTDGVSNLKGAFQSSLAKN